MCGKTGDMKLLLQSYWSLAMYWEEFEEGTKAMENMAKAFDLVVENRGGKAFVSLEDCSPMLRSCSIDQRICHQTLNHPGMVAAIGNRQPRSWCAWWARISPFSRTSSHCTARSTPSGYHLTASTEPPQLTIAGAGNWQES